MQNRLVRYFTSFKEACDRYKDMLVEYIDVEESIASMHEGEWQQMTEFPFRCRARKDQLSKRKKCWMISTPRTQQVRLTPVLLGLVHLFVIANFPLKLSSSKCSKTSLLAHRSIPLRAAPVNGKLRAEDQSDEEEARVEKFFFIWLTRLRWQHYYPDQNSWFLPLILFSIRYSFVHSRITLSQRLR